jgi:hypothetical protein
MAKAGEIHRAMVAQKASLGWHLLWPVLTCTNHVQVVVLFYRTFYVEMKLMELAYPNFSF